ncbi:Heterokaryon incompatibility protein 6, OR allele [Madurella mycetomatis]|uniref:Heterokaryon incompatibility protein 6, OR allele n=1 Tax=Madurella mycetomatis TaxID=100816 RepID=A0A175VNQ6_9PEZI|nr:Heterokaryon incompatibility protein 6, OR allele [Madurella mycetomatis]
MASPLFSGVSWRRPVNLEHPCLDINLYGFCNALSSHAVGTWIVTSFLRAVPLAVCGFFWPQSPTARMVARWVQAASLAAWLGKRTWSDSRFLIRQGNSVFDSLKHGPWIHPFIPISLVCTLNAASYYSVNFLESVFLRLPLGSLRFRARAMPVLFLGCVYVTASFISRFLPDNIYDRRNPETIGSWLSDPIRRFILAPLLWRNKRRRETLSTTFLGPGCHDNEVIPFTYSPLRSSKSIRLLEIVVNSQEPSTVSAELIDFDISAAPPYEAISYRWGDSAKTHHIRLGHTFPRPLGITKSAYDALCAVTPLQGTKHVWIDSICIDQKAPSDKLQQIPLMGEIYEGASLVTAYIPDPGDAVYANTYATRLAWSYLAPPVLNGPVVDGLHLAQLLMLFPENQQLPLHGPGWRSFKSLVYDPFWERAWIVQETILASRWRLLYGEICMSLEALFATTVAFEGWATLGLTNQDFTRDQKDLRSTCFYLFVSKSQLDSHNGIRQRQPLVKNLVIFSTCEATVPEDKVYALLGISSDPVSALLRQKLQQDGFMTRHQLSVFLVQQSLNAGSFLTFSISGTSQHATGMMGLPSWAPDFKSLSASAVLHKAGYQESGWFSAGLPHKADYTFSRDGDELRIRGVLLDHIHACSVSLFDPPAASDLSDRLLIEPIFNVVDLSNPEYFARLYQRALSAAKLVREQIPDLYMGAMDPLEALCRTILWNHDTDTMDLLNLSNSAVALEAMIELFTDPSAAPEGDTTDQELPETTQNTQIGWFSRDLSGTHKANFISLVRGLTYRQVAVTGKGYLASVPWGTKEGDVVCIFQGSPVPCILRPVKDEGPDCYIFHGEAYVQGWMHGEAVDLAKVWFTLR